MELSCPLGTTRCVPREEFLESPIINPLLTQGTSLLLTKLLRSRWLDIGLVHFCEFIDLDSVSAHKHAKKILGQYPAILTSHLVNNPHSVRAGKVSRYFVNISVISLRNKRWKVAIQTHDSSKIYN